MDEVGRLLRAHVVAGIGSYTIEHGTIRMSAEMAHLFRAGTEALELSLAAYHARFAHPGDPAPPADGIAVEARVRRGDGETRWIRSSSAVEDGVVVGLVVDVTATRAAASEASDLRFRELIENAPIGIGISRDGNTLYVNQACATMFGYQRAEDLVGGKLADHYEQSPVLGVSDGARVSRLPHYEAVALRRDGTRFHTEIDVIKLDLPDGPAVVGFARDVTERVRAVEALRESEQRFRMLIEHSPTGIYIREGEVVTYANPAFEDMLGYRSGEMLGMDAGALSPPDLRATRTTMMGKRLVAPAPITVRVMRKSGEEILVEARAFPVETDGRRTLIGNVQDITARERAREALEESEARFRVLSESSLVGVYVLDRGVIVYANRAMERMFGYEAGALTNIAPALLVHPDDRDLAAAWAVRRNAGDLTPADLRGLRLDGETLSMVVLGVPATLGDREVVIGNVADISERRRAEDLVRESEDRFRSLTECAIAGIIIIQDDRFAYVNPAFERMIGAEPGTLDGTEVRLVIHRDDLALVGAMRDRLRAVDEVRYEVRAVRRDGATLWLEVLGSTMAYRGRPATLGNALDISTRIAAEEARRASERQFASAFEYASIGKTIVALDGSFLKVNRMLCQITGYSAEELAQRRWQDITHPDDLGGDEAHFRELAAGTVETYQLDKRFVHKSGHLLWVRRSVSLVRDEDGAPQYAMSQIEDITARVHAETELERHRKHLEDLVAQRTEELRHARDAADDASRAKSRFLANMSHEIRTPMNAVLGFTQLLLRDPAMTADHRKHLDTINRAGDHLLLLIDGILQLAKVESGHETLVESPFDLRLLVEDVERLFRPRAHDKRLALSVAIDDTLPRAIRADEGKLRQVLSNLLGNAIKFTARGEVVVRVGRRDDRLMVEVEDTGPGISDADLGRLFQMFEQAEAGHASRQGTGLGLAISRELVRLMGGELTAQSRYGEGTVFRFAIPFAAAGVGELAPAVRARRVPKLAPDVGPRRVLVADDVEDNRALLVAVLALAGFETRAVADGAEAVEAFAAWRPHLVLMDLRMPVMDGNEATQRIRALAGGTDVKIVCVTASAFPEDVLLARGAGVDDFMKKPVRDDVLLDRIATLLGVRYAAAAPDELAVSAAATGKTIAHVPPALRQRLRDATRRADLDAMLALIDETAAHDAAAASYLRELAQAYAYQPMLDLLEAT